MRFISSGLAALLLSAIAAATPITLTFSGTASGSVGGSGFSDEPFSIVFTSDTTNLFTIPSGETDAGDVTTPNSTPNNFTIGTLGTSVYYSGELTGLSVAAGLYGPAVFLNSGKNNVGVWYFEAGDWLVTGSGQYTSSYGLANNLTAANVQAFPNDGPNGTGAPAMPTTVGPVDLTSVAGVTFSEVVGSTTTTGTTTTTTGTTTTTTGTTTPTAGPAADAPEPSTLMMLAIGIGSIGLGKIRKFSPKG